jgi:hypothetical protein
MSKDWNGLPDTAPAWNVDAGVRDAVTREQIEQWAALAGFTPATFTETTFERFGDFAIFARGARLPPPPASTNRLTDSDVYTLIGHASLLRGNGEVDMPAWFMDLAKRIALIIGDKELAGRVDAIAAKETP